jgi:hypothetical protein
MPNHIFQLDRLLSATFPRFVDDIVREEWQGKERDCVNRFAMGYLVDACYTKRVPFLKHPTQISIEMPIGKPDTVGIKKSLSKDLVIWRKPWASCWDKDWSPSLAPLAVIEWKVSRGSKGGKKAEHEKAWLRDFATSNHRSVGYAVSLRFDGLNPGCQITVARFFRSEHEPKWFVR